MNVVDLGWSAMLLVAMGGILSGALSWQVFLHFSNAAALRLSANRIVAHLFEIRLFAAEPKLILQAQRDLLLANSKFLLQVLKPSLVLLLPLVGLYFLGEGCLSRAPLQIGRPAIVTASLSNRLITDACAPHLSVPMGFVVETSPLYLGSSMEVLWRVRPSAEKSGDLHLSCGPSVVTAKISSTPGLQWLSPMTSEWLPVSARSQIKSVSISYPQAAIFGENWLLWFVIFSFAGSALIMLFRRKGHR